MKIKSIHDKYATLPIIGYAVQVLTDESEILSLINKEIDTTNILYEFDNNSIYYRLDTLEKAYDFKDEVEAVIKKIKRTDNVFAGYLKDINMLDVFFPLYDSF